MRQLIVPRFAAQQGQRDDAVADVAQRIVLATKSQHGWRKCGGTEISNPANAKPNYTTRASSSNLQTRQFRIALRKTQLELSKRLTHQRGNHQVAMRF